MAQMSSGHLAVPVGDVGAVAEGRRIEVGRDVAVRDEVVAEILARRGAVGRRGEPLVVGDLHRQPVVAEPDAVGGEHVDEVPGDVAGLALGAELRHRLGGAFVPDEVDAGRVDVGLGIGVHLHRLVGAAPGRDRHAVGAVLAGRQLGVLRGRGGHRQRREGGGSEQVYEFHWRLPCCLRPRLHAGRVRATPACNATAPRLSARLSG